MRNKQDFWQFQIQAQFSWNRLYISAPGNLLRFASVVENNNFPKNENQKNLYDDDEDGIYYIFTVCFIMIWYNSRWIPEWILGTLIYLISYLLCMSEFIWNLNMAEISIAI